MRTWLSDPDFPPQLITFNYNSTKNFPFHMILSLQKWCQFPLISQKSITVTLSFPCPVFLTSTHFDPFASTVVLAGMSKKTGV